MANLRIYCGMIFLWGCCAVSKAQNTTNRGTEFWVTFTSHINIETGQLAPPGMVLYITSDVSTSGTVSIPGQGYQAEFSVTPGQITFVNIPRNQAYVGSSETVETRGIYVSAEQPVVVYSHIYGERRSAATLVMPTRSLGMEYRAVTYSNTSQFTVVATEDDTWIEITPAAQTEAARQAGTPFQVRLQRGEVYQVRAQGDLTGSRITTSLPENLTCKRVAVFSGSMGVRVGCGTQGYDNLYQQLFAYSSWGQHYMAVPLANRPYDMVRILSGDQPSTVTINGNAQTVAAGRFIEIPQVTEPLVITADQPVSVAQFTPSQSCDPANPHDPFSPFYEPVNPGDPDMLILNPVEQQLDQVTLYSSSREDIMVNYINVIIRTGDAASFTMDGVSRGGDFTPIPADPGYSYARLQVSPGTHRLQAEGGFNAIAYGFGNYEAHAYMGGTNILDLSHRITTQADADIFTGTEGCSGRSVLFSAELDFEVLEFQWDFGDGNRSEVETDPGRLQNYLHTYAAPGTYEARLIVYRSDGTECDEGEEIEIQHEVNVSPHPEPEPDFEVPASCSEDFVPFENLSGIGDGTELTYRWDLGDGSPELTEEAPQYRFPEPGLYEVTLHARSRYGCEQAVTKEVFINASDPLAAFSMPGEICQQQPVSFLDESTVSFGDIIAWEWDFNGEGSSTEQHPVFAFDTPGHKTITLAAYSGETCFTVAQKELTVLPAPEARLALSETLVCEDTGAFQITGYAPLDGFRGGQGMLAGGDALDGDGFFHPSRAGPGRHEILYIFTNQEGCSDTASDFLTVSPIPQVRAGENVQVLSGNSIQLDATSDGVTYEWSPADGLNNPFIRDPIASPETTTTYTLRVTSETGCTAIDDITVEVLELLDVPNAFSPNHDGVNDHWIIENIEDYPDITVQVYNRYGDRVFYSKGYSVPWDGTADNRSLPPATYYYVIKPSRLHPPIAGSVTILR